jgi:hypothetical protein
MTFLLNGSLILEIVQSATVGAWMKYISKFKDEHVAELSDPTTTATSSQVTQKTF